MKSIRDLLIYSLDNELTSLEKVRLEKALSEQPELQKEKANLLRMRGLVSSFSISENAHFSDQVLQKIETQKSRINEGFEVQFIKLFPKVAAACVVFLLATFSVVYYSDTELVSDEIVGIEEVNLEDAYAYLEY